MAATTGKTGIGALLEMGDGASPEVFTAIANIANMSIGGVTLSFEDATQLASPDFYAEFLPTLKSADEWTLTVHHDPSHATHNGTTGMRKKLEDRILTNFQLDLSACGITLGIACSAYVGNIGNLDISPTGVITQPVTIRPVGKPTEYTPA